MRLEALSIPDVKLITPKVFGDTRGFFMETYRQDLFEAAGITRPFVQHNHSRSKKGILRGLHFQKGDAAQGKLVRVTAGSVYDVAVDLRPDSPTLGQWVGQILTDTSGTMMYIPEGFAHGFYVLSESADFFYLCTQYYAPGQEDSIRYDDPSLAISWPLDPSIPVDLSPKDAQAPSFQTYLQTL